MDAKRTNGQISFNEILKFQKSLWKLKNCAAKSNAKAKKFQ